MPIKVNFCKINTARLRQMRLPQLRAVQQRLYSMRHVQDTTLLQSYVGRLVGLHQVVLSERFKHGRGKREVSLWRDGANIAERKIWDAQARAGCDLGKELVARDAVLERRYGEANRIRRSKRRRPTQAQMLKVEQPSSAQVTRMGLDPRRTTRGARRRVLTGKK